MVAGTFGLIMTSPGQTYTVSIFIEHFIDDLSLSRSAVSTLYSLGTLAGSLTLPLWGRQIDLRGSRKMVVLIAFLFGLACIFMGLVQNLIMLGIGFVAIRMMGQGSLSLVSQTLINQWWVNKRGMIMGVSGLLMAILGIGAFPNLVHSLIGSLGWRATYPVLGITLIFVMVPIGFVFFRHSPETYGLNPDNANSDPIDLENKTPGRGEIRMDWELSDAMKTPSFWILLVSLASFTMLSTGQFFHLVSIFDDQGLSSAVAASAYFPIALATAATTLISGVAIDRIPEKYFLSIGLVFQALALLMIQFLNSTATAFVFGILLGVTSGIFRAVSSVVWPAFYGRTHLGSIFGFATAAGVLGAALGPVPFGVTRDLVGSYQPVLNIAAMISLLLGAICLTVKKPMKEKTELIH